MIDKLIKILFIIFLGVIVSVLVNVDRNGPKIEINDELPKRFLLNSDEPTWSSYFTVTDDKNGLYSVDDYEIDSSDVDFTKAGTQVIKVKAEDSDGNVTEIEMEIEVSSAYAFTGFEGYQPGEAFTRDKWEKEGFRPSDWDNGLEERTKITNDEAASGESSLEVTYPKGKYGSQDTGAQVELNIKPSQEYYSSYKIKFGDGFSWGSEKKGGKLPGLTGGDRCGDDFVCDGTDGFGTRYMWRDEGYPELYLYSAEQKNKKYGDDIPFMSGDQQFQFETGKWYTITEHVKLNSSPTSDDGMIEIWVDGEQVLDLKNISFVTDNQLIDTYYFSTFHGGHDADWQPTVTSKAYFDDIKISIDPNQVDF